MPKNAILPGWISGFCAVLIFSGSLPATRMAVLGFDPIFLTAVRAVAAGILSLASLLVLRQIRPSRRDAISLTVTSLGVVIAFPLLTAIALQSMTAAHSVVFTGLLPLATAMFGVLRGGERPRPAFWFFSIAGATIVVSYAISNGSRGSLTGDLLMLTAVVLCGLGYAEGAVLSRSLGGWQVISWALVVALPVTVPAMFYTHPATLAGISASAWLGLGYVSLFSMWIGFIFWYRGLSRGGIAAVSQLQLLQPFFAFMLAATLLHEPIQASMILVTCGVILCVLGAKRVSRAGPR